MATNKLWYIHSMEYCSAMKNNVLLIHPITWMNLKQIMLSKENTISKGYLLHNTIYIILIKYHNYRDEEQTSGFQGLGIGG